MPRKSRRKVHADMTPVEVKTAGNGSVDMETFLAFVAKLKLETARKAAVGKRLSATWKAAINAGIVRQDLEEILKTEDVDPKAVAESFARKKQYAEWMNVPIGKQLSIYEVFAVDSGSSIPTQTERAQRAYRTGFIAGTLGQNPDNQAYPPGHEQHNDMMAGWNDGQQTIREKFKALDPQLDEAEHAEFDRRMKRVVVPESDPAPDNDNAEAPEAEPMEG